MRTLTWWNSIANLSDLVHCPDCPRPAGLVPKKEMANHIAILHQGEAFRCAVCKFSGVTISFLKYGEMRNHLLEAHRVTEEASILTSILLPANIFRWSCKLCPEFKMETSKEMVIQHISEVHGEFYIASIDRFCSATCRICSIEVEGTGDAIRRHLEHHRREGFSKEEEHFEGESSPVPGDQIRPDLNTEKKINKEEKPPTRERGKVKRKSRSSSSSRTSSTSRSRQHREKSRHEKKKRASKSKSRARRSSPGDRKPTSHITKGRRRRSSSPSRSPSIYPTRAREVEQSPSHCPRRGRNRSISPWRDSRRRIRSKSRKYSGQRRSPSRSPRRDSRRRNRSRSVRFPSPRRSESRSPRRDYLRRNRSKSVRYSSPRRSESRSPRRDYLRRNRSKSVRYSSPRRSQSRSPRRDSQRRSQSRSPKRDSQRRNVSRSPKSSGVQRSPLSHRPGLGQFSQNSAAGDFMIIGLGAEMKYKCQVCNTLSSSRLQHDQHKAGEKHKKAKKTYCQHCKVYTSSQHFHCKHCDIHSSGPQPWQQHLQSSQHKAKLAKLGVKTPNNDNPGVSPPSAIGVLQCPACQQEFSEVTELKEHVRTSHDILITCTECEARGHNPVGEAIFCQELMDHYRQIHNKKMTVTDLPYYGKKTGEKMSPQGYVMCKLCPKPSLKTLGRPGLWFTNQLSLSTIRRHFELHPGNENYQEQIILGCQLCSDQLPGSRGEAQWRALLNKHSPADSEEEGQISQQPSAGGVLTSLCPYCGEIVPREGQAAQLHIKQRHLQLTFSCKLCRLTDRYYYQHLHEVFRHLRLKHFGVERNMISHVLLPGSLSNIQAFAWVKCRICDFQGIGGDQEVRDHLLRHPGSGQENLKIFCRLCHGTDRMNVNCFHDFKLFVEHFKAGHGDILRCL